MSAPGYCVVIKDASDTPSSYGELYRVMRFDWESVLDGLGSFSFTMPLADPRHAAVTRHARAYGYRIDGGGLLAVGGGIVEQISIDVEAGTLTASGSDFGVELTWRSPGELNVWKEESQSWDSDDYDCWAIFHHAYYDPHNTQINDTHPWGAFTLLTGGYDPDHAYGYTSRWIYFGRDRKWHDLAIIFDTPNTVHGTTQWQYYNGSSGEWINLTVTDGTVKDGDTPFGQNGTVEFAIPDDWMAYEHDSHTAWWIRARTVGMTDSIVITSATSLVVVATDTALSVNIAPLLPAGWSFAGSHLDTEHAVYAVFTQENFLEVLVKIAEQVGEHFRIDGHTIVWLQDDPTTVTTPNIWLDSTPAPLDTSRGIVTSLGYSEDTHELISRVIPYGAGHAPAQVTLAKCSAAAIAAVPAGFTVSTVDNYVKYDNAEVVGHADYIGRIEKRMYWTEIAPDDNAKPHSELAADALLKKAVAYLRTRCNVNYQYEITVIDLYAHAHVGNLAHVRYSVYSEGVLSFEVDRVLIVLRYGETWDPQQGIVYRMTVSTTDALARSDAEKVAEYLESDYVDKGHIQNTDMQYLTSGDLSGNYLPFSNGQGGAALRAYNDGGAGGSTPATHDHSGDVGDGGQFDADHLLAGGPTTPVTDGYVFTSLGTGYAAWESPNHNLLSAVHPDTLADSPVRGDLLVANSTPVWTRLPAGNQGDFLRMGAADPAWHALAAADLPAHDHTAANQGGDYAWADITGFAAPSVSVGLGPAAEGAAGTVLRSDTVLALDQSIAPTWTGQHFFSNATYPPVRIERTGSGTNALLTGSALRHHTSSDMVDGFGVGISFEIQDSADVSNILAMIAAVRAGADNTGDIVFRPYTAGVPAEQVRITSAGNVGINVVAPAARLEVNNGTVDQALIDLQHNGTSVFSIDHIGRLLAKPNPDSITAFQVQDKDGNLVLLVETVNNRVGICQDVPICPLDVEAIPTATSGANYAVFSACIASPATDSSGTYRGYHGQASLDPTSTVNLTSLIGLQGVRGNAIVNGTSGTVTGAAGLVGYVQVGDGMTVSNAYAAYLYAPTKVGTPTGVFTTAYGLYIASVASGATNWAIYAAGGNCYLRSNVLIGTTTDGMTANGSLAVAQDFAHRGAALGFFNTAPIAKVAAMTTALTTVTFTAPGTPDYAWGAGTNTNAYGWVTNDEFETAASVIANLQTRVNELETKLKAYGLFT